MAQSIAKTWQQLIDLAAGPAPRPDLDTAPIRKVAAAGVTVDYTKALVDDRILGALEELGDSCGIAARTQAMLAGERLNATEDRQVLHCALRSPQAPETVRDELERMLDFAGQVHDGEYRTAAGSKVKAVVHMGIGGSYLGPRLMVEALPRTGPACRFVANVDPAAVTEALEGLEPRSTLVVHASKSGTTTETLANTRAALAWLEKDLGSDAALAQLVVVSANPDIAARLGCRAEQAFRIWDWVGGRFSLWSSVSVTAAMAIGPGAFREFLAGAHRMDTHVGQTSGLDNLATTLALLRVWHALATGAQTHCVVAYQHRLRSLPAYLQQLVMESNGKSASLHGGRPPTATSAVWWGGEGTNDQHSYFQLLLQGMRLTPADFIVSMRPRDGEDPQMHSQLVAHALGQSRALLVGRDLAASKAELLASGMPEDRAALLAPHLVVPGGQPTNILHIERLTPETLGALIALYEHMTAALGWLWDINSFDQWGVELGKINFRLVLKAMEGGESGALDRATAELIASWRKA